MEYYGSFCRTGGQSLLSDDFLSMWTVIKKTEESCYHTNLGFSKIVKARAAYIIVCKETLLRWRIMACLIGGSTRSCDV
jgi:hypothetical protein